MYSKASYRYVSVFALHSYGRGIYDRPGIYEIYIPEKHFEVCLYHAIFIALSFWNHYGPDTIRHHIHSQAKEAGTWIIVISSFV